jgi:aromatic-L-amino-acid/L-tryptophan decarboxylase
MPYGAGNTHPRFFGWVQGGGNVAGILAELVSAVMNSNCGGRNHAAIAIERDVIDWSRRCFGLPNGASGLLVTGTSQATLLALVAARQHCLGDASRRFGLSSHPTLVLYAAEGVHSAIAKAMDVIGVGSENLRLVPIDASTGGMRCETLPTMIDADRSAGRMPFCIVGTAGSVDRGGFDPLAQIADVCRRENLWFHVDGAFGAWLQIAEPSLRALVDGIEKADTIACDFHKWMFVPYDCGMLLARDERHLRSAFALRPSYLASQENGIAGGEPWYCDYGVDLSRSFRALKVWATLRAYGTDRLGQVINNNCRLARYMAGLIRQSTVLRLHAPVISNVCCFGLTHLQMKPIAASALNGAIVARLQETGETVLSTTSLGGITVMRAAITNHRTLDVDVDAAVSDAERLATELTRSQNGG